MTQTRRLGVALINDGAGGQVLVYPGDIVEILPLELRKFSTDAEEYFGPEDFRRQQKLLGDGPHKIATIEQWPCGRIMFYLEDPATGRPGAGVYAEEFMLRTEPSVVDTG